MDSPLNSEKGNEQPMSSEGEYKYNESLISPNKNGRHTTLTENDLTTSTEGDNNTTSTAAIKKIRKYNRKSSRDLDKILRCLHDQLRINMDPLSELEN